MNTYQALLTDVAKDLYAPTPKLPLADYLEESGYEAIAAEVRLLANLELRGGRYRVNTATDKEKNVYHTTNLVPTSSSVSNIVNDTAIAHYAMFAIAIRNWRLHSLEIYNDVQAEVPTITEVPVSNYFSESDLKKLPQMNGVTELVLRYNYRFSQERLVERMQDVGAFTSYITAITMNDATRDECRKLLEILPSLPNCTSLTLENCNHAFEGSQICVPSIQKLVFKITQRELVQTINFDTGNLADVFPNVRVVDFETEFQAIDGLMTRLKDCTQLQALKTNSEAVLSSLPSWHQLKHLEAVEYWQSHPMSVLQQQALLDLPYLQFASLPRPDTQRLFNLDGSIQIVDSRKQGCSFDSLLKEPLPPTYQ